MWEKVVSYYMVQSLDYPTNVKSTWYYVNEAIHVLEENGQRTTDLKFKWLTSEINKSHSLV